MNQSAAIKAAAAAGGYATPPGLAFQHIPLPEHDIVRQGPIVGQYHEAVCAPEINTGLFAAYAQAGDVKAVTVGHDHVRHRTDQLCTPRESSANLLSETETSSTHTTLTVPE